MNELTSEGIPTDTKIVYLGVYKVSRHYGGPEEGGWWYDWYDYQGRSEAFQTECDYALEDPDIVAARDRILAEYADHQPEHDIYSMANEHGEYRVIAEDEPGDMQSESRPHYE